VIDHGLEQDISITIGIDVAKMIPNHYAKNSTASKPHVVEKLHFFNFFTGYKQYIPPKRL